ncbi:MAG: hypothetical protein KF779_18030 [Hyphomonadaceae bacterium]|jgi:hypothetical protein|nr:hypothetical protein [Caulobacterales bacterium]MBX3431488.1 hypothetical protein [Hyphomonadaceae bacterium]
MSGVAQCPARARGAPLEFESEALRPDRAPSRAGGVKVKSKARLDAVERDGIWLTGLAQGKMPVGLGVDKRSQRIF